MGRNNTICVHSACRMAAPHTCACKSVYVLNYAIVEYTSEATITMKSSSFRNL